MKSFVVDKEKLTFTFKIDAAQNAKKVPASISKEFKRFAELEGKVLTFKNAQALEVAVNALINMHPDIKQLARYERLEVEKKALSIIQDATKVAEDSLLQAGLKVATRTDINTYKLNPPLSLPTGDAYEEVVFEQYVDNEYADEDEFRLGNYEPTIVCCSALKGFSDKNSKSEWTRIACCDLFPDNKTLQQLINHQDGYLNANYEHREILELAGYVVLDY